MARGMSVSNIFSAWAGAPGLLSKYSISASRHKSFVCSEYGALIGKRNVVIMAAFRVASFKLFK